MKKRTRLITVFSALAATMLAFADGYTPNQYDPTGTLLSMRRAYGSSVKAGRWNPDLQKCLNYCKENGVPLFAIWSNGNNCGHCTKMENNLNSVPFVEWMKTSGIVFYFGYYDDPYPDGYLQDSCVWCAYGNYSGKVFPYVRVFWQKKGKSSPTVDYYSNGNVIDDNEGRCTISSTYYRSDKPFYVPGDYGTYNMGGRIIMYKLTNGVDGILRKWSPTPVVTYHGGEFGVADDATTGLQAELGLTESVVVPLARTNTASQAQVYTNKIVRVYPDSGKFTKTDTIVWAAGQSTANYSVDISTHTNGVKAGDQVILSLLDATNGVVAVNHITFVDKVANSPKNPFWIGEKTADTLDFGEWTMDLEAVTNKVKAYNAKKSPVKAYSMILVGGSLWCPDCAMADHWLFDHESGYFKAWAAARKVALGVVDIPNYTKTGTTSNGSLLTHDRFTMSDNYISGRGTFPKDENERYQSGAQYLSRHGVSPEDATSIIKRNKDLVQKDTLHGGYRRPESGNKYRPGVPMLLLLRDDGTIAGRFDTFSAIGPSTNSVNFLNRLDELLAQIDEPAEESNDHWSTTGETVVKRGTMDARTLSHTDLQDVYWIDPTAVGQLVNFKLSGAAATEARLSVISSANETIPLDTATGSLHDGLSVTYKIPSTNCYLVVAATRGSALQAESSVIEYSLSSDNVLVATEAIQVETVTDGNPVFTLNTEAGKTYRITNVDESKIEGVFTKAARAGCYVALTTGSSEVHLKDSTATEAGPVYNAEYQLWNTGLIGFDRGVATTKEISEDFQYTLKITRSDGVSGVAKARITLDAGDTIDDGSIFVWTEEGAVFEWADGSNDVKTATMTIRANSFADGEQHLTFKLTAVEGESDAGVDPVFGTLTLVIKDDDASVPGTLAITEAVPAFAKPMTVIAPPTSEVAIRVSREVGADGDANAVLKTSAGLFANGLSTIGLHWDSRSNDVKTVTLILPQYSDETKSFQVTLTSVSDAKVDNARKYLTVKLAEAVAAFDVGSTDVVRDATRYLPFQTDLFVNPTTLGAGEVSVEKYSGSLPPGLSWTYLSENNTLRLYGTPTVAGRWSAVFRVFEDGNAGGTAAIAINVAELAVADDDSGTPPANPSVAEARTFKDIIVINTTSTSNFAGLLTLTIPQSGRLSGKMRLVDGEVCHYLAEGWEELLGDGTLVATLNDVGGGALCAVPGAITLKVAPTGGIEIEHDGYQFVVPAKSWSASNPATRWKGYYTVSMPQLSVKDGAAENPAVPIASGPAIATLKMQASGAVNSGKMVYAGVLPNGKSFSGFGILTPDSLSPDSWNKDRGDYDYALLPVISPAGDDTLSGIFKVLGDSSKVICRSVSTLDGIGFEWCHAGARAELDRTTVLDAFGSFYNADDNIADACSTTFADDIENLYFFALTDRLGDVDGFSRSAAAVWNASWTGVRVWNANGVNKIKLRNPTEAKAANGLVFSYNRETGIVSGTFRTDFGAGAAATTAYRGVVMMHWGAGCGACGPGDDLSQRPFISGPAWFSDDHSVDKKAVNERRGFEFTVGVKAGE